MVVPSSDTVKASTLLQVAIGDGLLKQLVEKGTLVMEFERPTLVTLQLSLTESVKAALAPLSPGNDNEAPRLTGHTPDADRR